MRHNEIKTYCGVRAWADEREFYVRYSGYSEDVEISIEKFCNSLYYTYEYVSGYSDEYHTGECTEAEGQDMLYRHAKLGLTDSRILTLFKEWVKDEA